jgi:hypothetical protein
MTMPVTGHVAKRCGCRNPDTGKIYNGNCPKLRRPKGGWSSDHGVWFYQLELPHTTTGKRRQLRRGAFTTSEDAHEELDHATLLLRLAGRDQALRRDIADLFQAAVGRGAALPTEAEVRKRIRLGTPVGGESQTVGEYLTDWITELEKLDTVTGSTITSY